MTGLDKIIEQINRESSDVCTEIENESNQEIKQIADNAEAEGIKAIAEIEHMAELKCKDIAARGESSAQLAKRRIMLSTKQQVIETMLGNALESIKNLPDSEYFDLLLRVANKNSLSKKGEIAFNSNDLKRIPDDFVEKLNKASNGQLTISNNTQNIESGFVLIYGGIEENCSFDAMFRSKYEQLLDEASSLLFS